MQKKIAAAALLLAALMALTACADGPLVVAVTPSPTPSPTPQPTPSMSYEENVAWPAGEGLAALLPDFPCVLEVLSLRGEELLFAVFEEYDAALISDYRQALKDAGYTDAAEESDVLYSAALEGTDGLVTVQLMYEGGYGTLQLSDKRAAE